MSDSSKPGVPGSAEPTPLPTASPQPMESTEIQHSTTTAPASPGLTVVDEKALLKDDIINNQQHSTGQTECNSGSEYEDPLSLGAYKRPNVSAKQLKVEHPKANKRKLKKFYTQQNQLIDQFLQSGDEERLGVLDMEANGPKIKFAIYMSSGVNFCLFVIQMYAAITTGSLSLFATAADAFVSTSPVRACDVLMLCRWILCLRVLCS